MLSSALVWGMGLEHSLAVTAPICPTVALSQPVCFSCGHDAFFLTAQTVMAAHEGETSVPLYGTGALFLERGLRGGSSRSSHPTAAACPLLGAPRRARPQRGSVRGRNWPPGPVPRILPQSCARRKGPTHPQRCSGSDSGCSRLN